MIYNITLLRLGYKPMQVLINIKAVGVVADDLPSADKDNPRQVLLVNFGCSVPWQRNIDAIAIKHPGVRSEGLPATERGIFSCQGITKAAHRFRATAFTGVSVSSFRGARVSPSAGLSSHAVIIPCFS